MIPMQDLSEMLNPNSDKTMRLLDKHIPRSMLSLPISGEQLSNVLDELIREAKIRERDQVYFPLPDEHPLSQQSMFRNETKFTPEFQDIMTGEPMNIAFQLLKNDDRKDNYIEDAFDLGHPLLSYDELHDKQRAIVDTIADSPPSYWNDPVSGELETENYSSMFDPDKHHLYPDEAFDEYLRYIQHYHDASAKVSAMPHEEQIKLQSDFENPLHPSKVALDKMAEEYDHWNVENPHSNFNRKYNPSRREGGGSASRMAGGFGLHRGEPMDIAMRLLKASFYFGNTDPKGLQQARKEGHEWALDPSIDEPIMIADAKTRAATGGHQEMGSMISPMSWNMLSAWGGQSKDMPFRGINLSEYGRRLDLGQMGDDEETQERKLIDHMGQTATHEAMHEAQKVPLSEAFREQILAGNNPTPQDFTNWDEYGAIRAQVGHTPSPDFYPSFMSGEQVTQELASRHPAIVRSEPMDIAMRLLKMPIVDTDIPGVRMGYNEKWIHPHNYPEPTIGTQPYFTDFDNESMSGGEPSNKTHIGQMTPNEYFDIIQALAEKEGGVDRGHFTAPVIPGRDAEYRWDGMQFSPWGGSRENIARIIEGIKEGKPIGMPSLYFRNNEFTGEQDGGHRMEALRQIGHADTPVPVFLEHYPEKVKKSGMNKNLNRWFKEKWVDVSRKDKDGKHPPCGRSKAKKSSKGYPKCRPSVKVSSKTPKTSGSMSEGQKAAATKRKRSKKQGVGGKPTIVKMVKVI